MDPSRLLRTQFAGAWLLYYQLLGKTDERSWRAATEWYLAPARLAVHIPSSIEFYIDHESEMRERFEEDWSSAPIESIPSTSEVRKYAMATRSALNKWIDSTDLESTDVDRFPWVGETIADAAAFSLRHFQYHLGEWHAVLVQLQGRGVGDPWIPEG